jgi:lipopolysaccharide transport system ATP-binding protein
MSETVIQVDRLSKQYRLGTIGGKRLVDDFNRWWARVRGKEDPLSKVGPVISSQKSVVSSPVVSSSRNPSDILWALKDVSFEVKQGEVLGIIGRNGAGKSTLLKILSRVTAPTAGEVRVKGRIASLLEVGTGFHPELTGRENIFLNGAILGMTKSEIRKRLDEIVAFSEVEKFIDTPVKRYSSGMYVRLAFAVAAHLEPEILIVDEVLAVGDAAFQKKCLGKMQDVAGTGRTVLFVSHNLRALSGLCPRSLLLEAGSLRCIGPTDVTVMRYSSSNKTGEDVRVSKPSVITWLGIEWPQEKQVFDADHAVSFGVIFETGTQAINRFSVDCAFTDREGRIIVHARAKYIGFTAELERSSRVSVQFEFEPMYLSPGLYNLIIHATSDNEVIFWAENVPGFQISGRPHFGVVECFDEHKGLISPAFRLTLDHAARKQIS